MKIQVTVTLVKVFEVNPESYDGSVIFEEEKNFNSLLEQDPLEFFGIFDDCVHHVNVREVR